jgi:peptidoglycan/xylan/chitin deacetylase (PgdA/CDA1 family)
MSDRLALVVMYHYVWPDEEPIPGGIRPLRASEFEEQLDWLAERYEIVGADEFLRSYREPSDRPPCLLTFDDGTRDQAEVAAPILARRGLSGVFFIATGPASGGPIPLTHALHWLLGQDERDVWEAFERYAVSELGGPASLGSEDVARSSYYYESPLRARIKYAANMALPAHRTREVIERLVRAHGKTMRGLAEEWFASSDQLVEMARSGMTIGMHGVTHQSLQVMGPDGTRREIRECARFLRELLGAPPRWWACPFGGTGAPEETISTMYDELSALGVEAAVSTASSLVNPSCHPWALPRVDAAALPPRRAPQFVGVA